MASDVNALFDKIYNDRIVKQSVKRKKLRLDSQKLRRLVKQRYNQVSKVKGTKIYAEVASRADDKELCTSKYENNSVEQDRDEVQIDKQGRVPASEMARKSLKLTKETFNVKNQTRTDVKLKGGNENKANHIGGHYTVGINRNSQLDQQCKERNFWIDQHSVPFTSEKEVLYKAERSIWAELHAKRHKPCSSLFHAGPVRQSIVEEV